MASSILYNPANANSYVWPMIPKAHKAGMSVTYQMTREPSPKPWEDRGWILCGPCQLGRYGADGVYETYKPPTEGVSPVGRYVRHPWAAEQAENYERDQINSRYAAKNSEITESLNRLSSISSTLPSLQR